MNKKGVTYLEMILVAIVAVTLLLAYTIFTQSASSNILQKLSEQEIKLRCSNVLSSTVAADYKRTEGVQSFYGSYSDLQDHYEGFPFVYTDSGMDELLEEEGMGVTNCDEIIGTLCYVPIFDPYELLRGREALCRVGMVGESE